MNIAYEFSRIWFKKLFAQEKIMGQMVSVRDKKIITVKYYYLLGFAHMRL